MEENNIEWGGGGGGEIDFNIKSNLNKKISVRQAVLYTFGKIVAILMSQHSEPTSA